MSTSFVEMPELEEGSWGLDEALDEASSYLVLTLRLQLNLVRYFPWIQSFQKEEFQPYLFQ